MHDSHSWAGKGCHLPAILLGGLQLTPTHACLLVPFPKMPFSLSSLQAISTGYGMLGGASGVPPHETQGLGDRLLPAMFHIPRVEGDFSFYVLGE